MLLPLILTILAAPQDAEPEPAWTGTVTAGISATEGNTDIKKASATADGKKELAESRYTFGLSWNFSQESDLITQRKSFGKAQYDHFFTEKTYWLAQSSAEADVQAGVDLRTTLGLGAGARIFLGGGKIIRIQLRDDILREHREKTAETKAWFIKQNVSLLIGFSKLNRGH